MLHNFLKEAQAWHSCNLLKFEAVHVGHATLYLLLASGAPMAWCFGCGGGKMEIKMSGEESDQGRDDIFLAVEGGSWVVRGGWPATVVWIQCFSFGSRGEAIG
jgi:hypothetical protein